MNNQFLGILSASAFSGLATWALAQEIVSVLRRPKCEVDASLYDEQARTELRAVSVTYRLAEPLVQKIAATSFCQSLANRKIAVALARGGHELPYQPGSFVAVCLIRSSVLAVAAAIFVMDSGAMAALLAAVIVMPVSYQLLVKKLIDDANTQRDEFESGLPFAIDLTGLMLNAGTDLYTAISIVADEAGKDPIGRQFRLLRQDLRDGQTLDESLTGFEERMDLPALSEMAEAVRKSDELGTPLSRTFLNLAEQMRLKKSQWVEAASGKAQIKIALPTLLIMIACMISICAPFLLGALQGGSL